MATEDEHKESHLKPHQQEESQQESQQQESHQESQQQEELRQELQEELQQELQEVPQHDLQQQVVQAGFGGLGVPLQAVAVVGAPAFPNSVKWSQDNLLAIASGHLVTILNPAELTGPKGFVPITQSPIFDIGRVQPADFYDPELMQFRLAREGRTAVRSIDWSPQGVASHGGCLLAVCTTDSRVKLYRAPFCDYTPEWVEVGDVTELMYNCCIENKFQAPEIASEAVPKNNRIDESSKSKKKRAQTQEPEHRKVLRTEKMTENTSEGVDGIDSERPPLETYKRRPRGVPVTNNVFTRVEEDRTSPVSSAKRRPNGIGNLEMNSPRKTRNPNPPSCHDAVSPTGLHSGSSRHTSFIAPIDYAARKFSLSPLVIAWSSTCYVNDRGFVFCAVGTKAGSVWLLRIALPEYYSVEIPGFPEMSLLGEIVVHKSWITTLSWAMRSSLKGTTQDTVVLATGSSDGSVKLWSANLRVLALLPSDSRTFPLTLLREVIAPDNVTVSSLALIVPHGKGASRPRLAFGKGAGQVSVCEFDSTWVCTQRGDQSTAHDQVITGLGWTADGRFLYSCSQDNVLHAWELWEDQLCSLPVTNCSSILKTETPQIAIDLPASVLDLYYGIALSPGMLTMAVVRGVTADMVDQMYQARAQKGVVHLFWIGCQKSKSSMDEELESTQLVTSIEASDFQSWQSQILVSLHQMEDAIQPLILWDILAALSALKPVTNAEFVQSIILDWASTWCEGFNTDTLCTSLDSSHLESASCRQLQIFCVLYRQLLLADCRSEVLSGRTSLEKLDAPTKGSGHFLHSADQEDQLKQHLSSVEHELRQRLFFGTLSLASSLESAEQLENRLGDMEVVRPLLVDWVIANKSECFPQLVQLADEISSNHTSSTSVESCSFCDADVRLESPEVAYCNGVASENGFSKHKLQRCSVSFKVCPGNPLWYCSCCARWAAALAPVSFFALPSRLPSGPPPPSQQSPLPACPFCGVLMHRYLPNFLLSPKLF